MRSSSRNLLSFEDAEKEEVVSGSGSGRRSKNNGCRRQSFRKFRTDSERNFSGARSSRNLSGIEETENGSSGQRSHGFHRFRTDDSSERNLSGSSMREVSEEEARPIAVPSPPKKKMDPPARERPVDNVWPERDALSFTRSLVFYGNGAITPEHVVACNFIIEARDMRLKYQGGDGTVIADDFDECSEHLKCKMGEDGIMGIYDESDLNFDRNLVTVPDLDEFVEDYRRLVDICADGAMRSYW